VNDPVTFLQGALVLTGALTLLLWRIPGPCVCEKCAFHVNEVRMERARQRDLEHEYAHKGSGFRDTSPDKYDCPDPFCDRNRHQHDESTL
jgi:hypothetical protein